MTRITSPDRGILLGRVLSALVVLILLADAAVSLFAPHLLAANMAAEGFPPALATPLGIILLICTALYAFPRTSVLGAILITAFLGGAICVHFRLGNLGNPQQIICIAIAVVAWGGLYLREPRLRRLIPLRNAR